MDATEQSHLLVSTNWNSNMVLALAHRLAAGPDGRLLPDGLANFGVLMLVGVEPRVVLATPFFHFDDLWQYAANQNVWSTRSCRTLDEKLRCIQRQLAMRGYGDDPQES